MGDESFQKNVRAHVMTVELDHGVHRCLHFGKPGSSDRHFRLTTWPGYLCYTGDMGCFTFTRLQDMFDFFRNDRGEINPGYWAEKLAGVDRSDGAEEFDFALFKRRVYEGFRQHWEGTTDYEARRECWDELRTDLLEEDFRDYTLALTKVLEFRCNGLTFDDFWEYDLTQYTSRFLWCLRAIVWGIQQYDTAKASNGGSDSE